MKIVHRAGLAVVVGAALLSAGMSPANAADPKATITAPTAGASLVGTSVTVRGNYSADSAIKDVRVALCKLDVATKQRCTAYLSDPATGSFLTAFRSIAANRTPNSQVSGTFSLTGTSLPAGAYRAAAFAVTSSNPKGPSMQVTFTLTASDPDPTPGFVTILWGRTNWSVATGARCNNIPAGARTLEQNLIDLQSRGLKASGGVVVNRTAEATRTCVRNTVLQPSWADLARLRDDYGFTVVSQGMNYADMTLMRTDAQRFEESGATLPIFNSRGFTRAWGSFSYPNNKIDAPATAVVSNSFAFGRIYGTSVNKRANVMTYPYYMQTISVMGGRCNNPSLACYTMPVSNNRRTAPPSRLAGYLSPKTNEWGVVQFYRIVEGLYGRMGGGIAWDCSSSDWRNRWTSHPEIYCRNNFLEALDLRANGTTNADAVTVAQAWGRTPG